jgi:glycosyltransferase involved in cell wall biosynthesis
VRQAGEESAPGLSLASKDSRQDSAGDPNIASFNPLISVVVPVYDACRSDARFLWDALESVCAQTYRNFELIIVDDGSTDATQGLCEEFMAAHASVSINYFRKENGGQSSARNVGIAKSRGEYVSFLDQDDLWYPDKLARVVPALSGGIDMLYTDADTVDRENRILQTGLHRNHGRGGPHPKRTLEDGLFCNVYVMPGLMTVRRPFIVEIGGFDEALSGYEDDDLFLRAFQVGTIAYLAESTLKWRRYEDNYSYSSRMLESRQTFWRKLMATYTEGGSNLHRVRGISRRCFRDFLSEAVHQSRRGNPAYANSIEAATQLVPYLPALEGLVFGRHAGRWCQVSARSDLAWRLLRGWWQVSGNRLP